MRHQQRQPLMLTPNADGADDEDGAAADLPRLLIVNCLSEALSTIVLVPLPG